LKRTEKKEESKVTQAVCLVTGFTGREQGDSSGMPCDWFYWKGARWLKRYALWLVLLEGSKVTQAVCLVTGFTGREQGDSSGMPCDWFYWKFQVLISVGKQKVLTYPSRFWSKSLEKRRSSVVNWGSIASFYVLTNSLFTDRRHVLRHASFLWECKRC